MTHEVQADDLDDSHSQLPKNLSDQSCNATLNCPKLSLFRKSDLRPRAPGAPPHIIATSLTERERESEITEANLPGQNRKMAETLSLSASLCLALSQYLSLLLQLGWRPRCSTPCHPRRHPRIPLQPKGP